MSTEGTINTSAKRIFNENIFFLLTSLLAFTLPLSRKLSALVIGIIVFHWFFTGNWQLKISTIRKNGIVFLPACLYIFFIAGLYWTRNIPEGWRDLEIKLSLFIFPLVFGSGITLNKKQRNAVISFFIAGCLLAVIIGLFHSLYLYLNEQWLVYTGAINGAFYNTDFFFSNQLSYFHHPSYFALYLSTAIIFLLYRTSINKQGDTTVRILFFYLLAVFFSVIVFFLSSRMGILILCCIWIVMILNLIIIKKNYTGAIIILTISVVLIGMAYKNSQIIASRFEYTIHTLRSDEINKSTTESSALRILVWEQALQLMSEAPWFGFGTGDVKDVLMIKYNENKMTGAILFNLNAHNQFFQTAIAIGIPGSIFLLLTMLIPMVTAIRKKEFIISVLFIIISLNFCVESMLEVQAGVVYYSFIYVLGTLRTREDKSDGKLNLLFLTQYFYPETGAPQNRLLETAKRLVNKNVNITVLTAMPNYPAMKIFESYKGKFYCVEDINGIKIHRSWLYVSESKSLVSRLLNYFSFVLSSLVIGFFRTGNQDYVFCESPPLFLGISAYCLKKLKGAKLIFNVSDLWPESAEKLGIVTNPLLLGMAYRLESFIYSQSYLITGQTQGIVNDITSRFPGKNIHWFPNSVDVADFNPDLKTTFRKKFGIGDEDFVLLYAGLLGYAQGLEVIIKCADRAKDNVNIKFIIAGDGPEKGKLVQLADSFGIKNVLFLNSIPKNKIPDLIAASDASIIPLRKIDLFRGAIPSKIFEVLAMKRPILMGIEGEAKDLFIRRGNAGLSFVPDDDYDLYVKLLELYQLPDKGKYLGENGHRFVNEYFNRDKITNELYNLFK